ncbi:hypothetical protein K1T71_011151 [Dendrolimus kikuchii]|uniref:Uncharacterized protein n=1 Tax=Dendrolimus kikuchii TaxID=765133 RepID=A0ACC1CN94_9NEOP|nr:hypothetical protein K1T71_011151 [Dendrolimus kikuchii]
MAPMYLFFALIIQSSFIFANEEPTETVPETSETITSPKDSVDETLNDYNPQDDWLDMFTGSNMNMHPTSSVAMMTQAINSNKTVEEQLAEIKYMAEQIMLAVQSELTGLLACAVSTVEKDKAEKGSDDNNMRKRRSVETPMDSTQMVMRLLKHIKSNNDYQNIAIEKMMTAQEIAEKYNIPFNPDPEILSDLAVAANEHAKELSAMLTNQANEMKSSSEEKITFVPIEEETVPAKEHEDTYYVYAVHPNNEVPSKQQAYPSHDYRPQQIPGNHHHHNHPSYDSYYSSPYDTQIPAPSHHHHNVPVSQKPSFYDLFTPQNDYYPDAITSPVMIPFEEIEEPEPELIGEEFEETVTSKVIVDRGDEPGSATVNHVMTYTVSEKSHFKTPQIEKLPQQLQYCFLLI